MYKLAIVDTSVIIKWLNKKDERYIDIANNLLDDALDSRLDLLAPELAKYEVGNALYKGKKLNLNEGSIVLTQFYTLPITFVSESDSLAISTYEFATKFGITYYDASFLALAKFYNATLITDNIKHHGKTTNINVIALKDYISR